MPAPVYVVGDPDAAFDVVLIPDTDIPDSEMETFRDHCRRMIREAFLDEPTIRLFRRSFNFYINPFPGHAIDYSSFVADQVRGAHQPPVNFGVLDFAEGRVLLHKRELRDYALINKRLFSTEMQNRGTMLHECGHALFGLADEYPGGVPWKAEPYPNVWDAGSDAAAEALSRGKWPWDVRLIDGTNPRWWKLCVRSCQMSKSRGTHTIYDWPCHGRVEWCVLDNALH